MDHSLTPAQSLQRLLDGNDRFVSGNLEVGGITASDLAKHSEHQQAFAVVLTCADSRLPVERLFDVGLGQVFVVRVAGNHVSPAVAASIEFAVGILGSPLVVVMGHSDCGAIRGALNRQHQQLDEASPLRAVLADIASGIMADGDCSEDIPLSRAVALNVQRQVNALRATDALRDHLAEGRLWVVGAFYEIATGMVRLLEHKGAEVGQPVHDADDEATTAQ